METYAKSADITKHPETGSLSRLIQIDLSKEELLDKLLFFIKPVVEYAFGMHIGFAAGWLIGLGIGHSYVEHFKPVYFEDLIGQLDFWRLAPYIFAKYGAIIGVTVGIVAVTIINNILLNLGIISMYENGISDPNDIAQFLGKNIRQIKRRMKSMIEKGKINLDRIVQ